MMNEDLNSDTSHLSVYSFHLLMSLFRYCLHLLRNPRFPRHRQKPLLPQPPPTLTKPMLALPKRTTFSGSPRELTRRILIVERSKLFTSNHYASSSRRNVHFRVVSLMPLFGRVLESCSHCPYHEQLISTRASAEQVGDELVGCQESCDGFGVCTLVPVDLGIGDETYVGVSKQGISCKRGRTHRSSQSSKPIPKTSRIEFQTHYF